MSTPMEVDDHAVVEGGGIVPSLVVTGDFPSWDWTDQDTMLTSSATGSFSDDLSLTAAGAGAAAGAVQTAQASRVVGGASARTNTTTKKTLTPSATNTSNSTIQVLVAGVPYSVPLSLVPRLSHLPWEPNRSLPTLCPKLFEIVLHHLLFQALPNVSKLADGDTEELETLALLLELPELEQHVTRGGSGGVGGRINGRSRGGRIGGHRHPPQRAPPPLGEDGGLPPSASSSSSISTVSGSAVSSSSSPRASSRRRRGSFFARRRQNGGSDHRSWNGGPSVSENHPLAVAVAGPLPPTAGAPLRPRALQMRASSTGSETVLRRNTTTTTTIVSSSANNKAFQNDIHEEASLVGPVNGGYVNGDDDEEELPIHRHPHYCLT